MRTAGRPAMSNRRKLRPVRVVDYPGPPPLLVSLGRPPDDSFGDPPDGQLDIMSRDGSDPPAVLLALATRTSCASCGKKPGLVWLDRDGYWHTFTRHDPDCPDSVEQRGPVNELIAVPSCELRSTS